MEPVKTSNPELLQASLSPSLLSEEWLELSLFSGRAGVWEYRISTDRWRWSKSCAPLFGVPLDAIAGRSAQLLQRVCPRDRQRVAEQQRQAIESGTDYSIEFRILLPDGKCRWLLQRGQKVNLGEGKEPYWSGLIEDIDERKRLDTNLRDREQLNRQILDAIADMVLVKGPQSEIIWANQAFRDYYGMTNEQLQSCLDAPFNKPDHTLQYVRDDAYVFNTGQTLTIPEEPVTRHDGEIRLFQTVKSAIRNSDGQIVMTVGVSRDIGDRKAAEVALAESEAKFRHLVENANDFIYTSTPDGVFTYVSPQMAEVSGYAESELVGRPFVEFVHPDDLPICTAYAQQMLEFGRAAKEVEFRSRRKDGSWYWLAANTSVCKNADGKIVSLQGIAREISDRKALEEQLAEQQDLLETFVSSSPVGIAILDSNLRVVQMNEALAQLEELSVSKCLGKTLRDILPPERMDSIEAPILQVFQTGEPLLGVETAGRAPEAGEIRAYLASYFPLSRRGGQAQLVGVVLYDISDRKRAEDERARLTAILEYTSDFVGICDLQGRNLYMNQAGRHLFEIAPEEDISDIYIAELIPARVKDQVLKEGIPTALRDGIWRGDSAILTRSGREVPVSQVIIAHKTADGVPQYLSTIVRDMSDRKAVEDRMRYQTQQLERTLQELRETQAQLVQTEKMSSLGQLVAGIAHEINNPINFIHGNLVHADQYVRDVLELLELYQQTYPHPTGEIEAEAEALDIEFVVEDLSKLLSSMKMGSDRIRQIVLSLRNFSRLDEAEMKPVDLHEGLDSSLLVLQHRFNAKPNRPEIQVIREYGNLTPIECYAGQFNQVAVNIL
ncbi:MAG: PAS domain S-box protein, partial [Cyanobacteriota bacterium]|nr:PAS domain S-box protein [Cyanobacteriota bacterium]